MSKSEPFHDVSLYRIGILVFVDHDVPILLAQVLTDILILCQELPEKEDQIIIVHEVVRFLVFPVEVLESIYMGNIFQELCIVFSHESLNRLLAIGRLTQNAGQGGTFWEPYGPSIYLEFSNQGLDHLFHIGPVQDGKSAMKSQKRGIVP